PLLTGLAAGSSLMHGESLFEGRLRDRVLFLMNNGLTPTDGYLWRDRFFAYNNLTGGTSIGEAAEGSASSPIGAADPRLEGCPPSLRDPGQTVARAKQLINATALYFATKRSGGAAGVAGASKIPEAPDRSGPPHVSSAHGAAGASGAPGKQEEPDGRGFGHVVSAHGDTGAPGAAGSADARTDPDPL